MILKALYDYYQRCDELPAPGLEEKEIGFLIVISKEGKFIRFEDCRIDKNRANSYLVKKHVGRSSAAVANYLYDNSAYVLGFAEKNTAEKNLIYFNTFKQKVEDIFAKYPDNADLQALRTFYQQDIESIQCAASNDPLWSEITKNLSKKYSTFSFRIEGDLKIIAEKREILDLQESSNTNAITRCLVTGNTGDIVETTTATMIPGSQASAKLVAFQVSSGYDSYGKKQGANAPICQETEFAYTTALNYMLRSDSRNKFRLGDRTFVFWASSNSAAAKSAEESLFDLLGFSDNEKDNPNAHIKKVKEVFKSIYSGILSTELDDKFYILGLAPNSARIAVTYWSETSLKDFAARILSHFDDMKIHDTRKEQKPYSGVREMISAVTLGGKLSDATPNLPEAVVKSVFERLPYPSTLYSACLRRIRAEQHPFITRVAIIKAYLNRLNDNGNKKIEVMLDKQNTNQGYLCGRLFAVLVKIQEEANNINTIRERYMNAASTTPSTVFATLFNLSSHHLEKLGEGRQIWFEKLKQEIMGMISSEGFPSHLNLQDQGRFFVGYYHQYQDFFTPKATQE